jgi:hypothetical protein
MIEFAFRSFWTEPNQVVDAYFVVLRMNKGTIEPMYFAEPAIIVRTLLLSVSTPTCTNGGFTSAYTSRTHCTDVAGSSGMLELALISLMTGAVFLKIAAWWYFIYIVNV